LIANEWFSTYSTRSYPPALNTNWIEKDDSTAKPGALGNWRNDTLDVTMSGQWIMK